MPARCFIAIDLQPATIDRLARTGAAFRSGAPAWEGEKWVDPALLHVTVRFIGALPDSAVGDLLGELTTALSGMQAFTLRLAGVRAVPAHGRASMLWAGLDGDVEAGRELHATIERVLEDRFGVGPEKRGYSPHITIVRARAPRPAPRDALVAASAVLTGSGKDPDGFVSVPSITLYASTLGTAGPVYSPLGRVALGGA